MPRQNPLMRISNDNKIRKALRMRCFGLDRNDSHKLLAWLMDQLEQAYDGDIEAVAITFNRGLNIVAKQ